jgi:hypothetical protein
VVTADQVGTFENIVTISGDDPEYYYDNNTDNAVVTVNREGSVG